MNVGMVRYEDEDKGKVGFPPLTGSCFSMTFGLKRVYRSLTVKSLLHIIAMYAPHDKIRVPFHKMRGTNIGKDVFIGPGVFIEETRPELVTIEDGVHIAPRVTIVAHDASYHVVDGRLDVRREEVIIRKRSFIGCGSTILPGITIGEGSIVAAGSLVNKEVPPGVIVGGVPAKVIGTVNDAVLRKLGDLKTGKPKKQSDGKNFGASGEQLIMELEIDSEIK